jgi:outer membrane protein OmpA-like peptidoglycan-associated protein
MMAIAKGWKAQGARILFAATGLVLAAAAAGWASGEGTTAVPFLKIGTSSRAEAMGGAFTAVVDDVDATTWNPAGLTQLQRSTVGFSHMEWFEGIRYETLSYADKYDYVGAIGATIGYLYMGDIPKTVETVSGDYDPVASGGTFGASDLLVNLAWAGNLFVRENRIGVGVKVIQEHIDASQSFSFGVDLGDQFLLSKTRWYRKAAEESWAMNLVPGTVAFTFKNLGTPLKYSVQTDPLPMSAQVGLAYQFLDEDLTAALDFEYRMSEQLSVIHTGAEYWIRTGVRGSADQALDFAVRAGYRTGYDSTSAPGFSFGAGMVYSAVGLDYVFMPFGELGGTHRVSLKFSWGDVLKDKTMVKRRTVVKKTLSPSEAALEETASEMNKLKRTMEGKVVVKKTAATKGAVTVIEAKKPEGESVAKEAQTLGGEVPAERELTSGAVTNVVKGPGIPATGKMDSAALIAQITKGSKTGAGSRTQTQYLGRTREDAVRAARLEAESKSKAFDEVETAAQQEAKQSSTEGQVTKTTVYFAKNSDALNDRYLYALDQIAVSFDRNPARTLLVHGYASAGEADANNLSIKRAKAVKDYLVQIKSIAGNKISVKGFGDKDPAASNDTEKGRARNRRVRVQIIQAGN